MRLKETIEAYRRNDPAARSGWEVFWLYNGLHATMYYRVAHWLYEHRLRFLGRWVSQFARRRTGIEIHPAAKIGRRLVIDHGTGIVIGETTVIGDHVKVYQGVTLGALTTRGGQSLRGKRRHPTIEDNVTIYAGASILGGDTVIGRDCVIGSNVFITHSIPPCTTVSVKSQELQIRQRANCPGPFWPEEKNEGMHRRRRFSCTYENSLKKK